MKNPLLVTIFFCISNLFGQKARTIDLQVHFLKPDTNETILAPINYPIQLRITNLGPDTLKPGDVFRYYTSTYDSGVQGAFTYTLNQKYAPKQYFDITHFMKIDAEFDLDFYNIGILSTIYNLSADSIKPEWRTIVNNRPSVIVKVKLSSNNLNHKSHDNPSLYPNPCTDRVFVQIGISDIGFYNINGTLLFHCQNAEHSINLPNLKPGIYWVKYTIKGVRHCSKLIKI